MFIIQRPAYLEFLKSWKDKPVIKVVSGIRRCGKSTLFFIFQDYLLNQGIAKENIIQINLETPDFLNYETSSQLYEYLKPKLKVPGMKYVFIDEVQHIKNFEKIADALNTLDDVDLYLTGSNGYFMSGELGTLLTGRYVELKMLPLSFKEYVDGYNELFPEEKLSLARMYNNYLHFSSFPFTVQLHNNSVQIREYLDGIYSSILYRDVLTRLGSSDKAVLERIVHFIFDNIGSQLSIRKIANTITSDGMKVSPASVSKYLDAIVGSLMVYRVPRFDIHGRKLLQSEEKYYIADMGLRYFSLPVKKADSGHILENIVYLELLRRNYNVSVGKLKNGEIDFVAQKGNEIEYYQVSQTVLDAKTMERELKPFDQVDDHYPKFLLTLDEIGAGESINGVRQLNVLDWLIDK